MFDDTRNWFIGQFKDARPAFASKNPHFNFITVHYFWIIGATLFSATAIFIGGKGATTYTNSLMFGSGANTQAGLNPIDVNNLNGFQQSMIYLFALLSNPITIHTSVVFLRLYWFEKRFQDLVRGARMRRRSISKSRSKARNDIGQQERHVGVGNRSITILPRNSQSQRLTHDGILVSGDHSSVPPGAVEGSNGSDATTITDERNKHDSSDDIDPLDPLDKLHKQLSGEETQTDGKAAAVPRNEEKQKYVEEEEGEQSNSSGSGHGEGSGGGEAADLGEDQAGQSGQGHTAITFADTVIRSDGMGTDATKFPQHFPNSSHIAIVERQRNQDNEVLRIPGPRDIERGLGPRRLEEHDRDEEDHPLGERPAYGSPVMDDSGTFRGRQPTITISAPDRHTKDERGGDAQAAADTHEGLRFRKPRIPKKDEHRDDEDHEAHGRRATRTKTMDTIRSALSRDKAEDMPYLSYTPTIGRNSNFFDLTWEQREELGGIEYRSLRTLALILLFYFWGFHLLSLTCLLPFILHSPRYGRVLDNFHVGKTWWAFWTSNMAFMDVGFALTPDSMNSFATAKWVLIAMWFFIIIGNTGFPVMLRFLIWAFSKITPKNSGLWEELMFLLDHPRRCFTLLFPSNATWWLFWILIALNIIDLFFFLVLDLGTEPVHALPLSDRVVVGLFQAASTRTAGFSASNIAELHPGMPVLYMIMMYISVFPIAISIRRTNVYEEKSLGIYPDTKPDADDAPALSYVGTHLRRQLSFDLWYIFLGFFLLAITEGGKIRNGDFDLFAVLFEIISAYGTVGLSLGVPNVNASLCSQFSVVGKLIIVAMQIRGRHRALPYGLDRAILLPNESRFKKEAEEAEAAPQFTAAAAAAFASGAQRPPTSASRRYSKSRERSSHLITKFLHPGPVIHDELVTPAAPNQRSTAHGHRRTRSQADIRQGPVIGPKRTLTVPSSHNQPLQNVQPSYQPLRTGNSF